MLSLIKFPFQVIAVVVVSMLSILMLILGFIILFVFQGSLMMPDLKRYIEGVQAVHEDITDVIINKEG